MQDFNSKNLRKRWLSGLNHPLCHQHPGCCSSHPAPCYRTPESSSSWPTCLGRWYPHGRPGWSSKPLAFAWSSPKCYSHLEGNPWEISVGSTLKHFLATLRCTGPIPGVGKDGQGPPRAWTLTSSQAQEALSGVFSNPPEDPPVLSASLPPGCPTPPAHLHVIGREDAQSAVVLPFQPVLVHLLVDVNDVTLLKSELPAGHSEDSKLSPPQPACPQTHPPLPGAAQSHHPWGLGKVGEGKEERRGSQRKELTWGTVPGSQT